MGLSRSDDQQEDDSDLFPDAKSVKNADQEILKVTQQGFLVDEKEWEEL